MSDNDIYVRIITQALGAETAAAQTVDALRSVKTASEAANVSSAAFFSQTQAGSANIMQMASSVRTLSDEMGSFSGTAIQVGKNASSGMEAASEATAKFHGMTTRARTEVIVLAHEMVQGRFSRIPGSLMVLAESMGGVSLATWGVVGAVSAAAGAMGYLTERSIELDNAISKIRLGSEFANDLDLNKTKLREYIQELEKLPHVSRDDAEETVGVFARMRGASVDSVDALSRAIGLFSEAEGVKAPAAAKALVSVLEEQSITAKELQNIFPNITQAQVDNIQQTQRAGNVNQTMAEMLALVRDEMKKSVPSILDYNTAMHSTWGNWAHYLVEGKAVIGTEGEHRNMLKQATAEWEKHTAAIDADIAKLKSMPAAQPLHDQPSPIGQTRDTISEYEASFSGAQSRMLAHEAQIWQQTLAGDKLTAKERVEAQHEYFSVVRREHLASVSEFQAAERKKTEAMHQAWNEQREIAMSGYRTDLSIAQLSTDRQHDLLEQQVQEGKITEAEKLSALRDLTNQQYALTIAEAEKERDLYKDNPVQYAHYTDQVRLLKAKLAADLAAIDADIAKNNSKTAKQQSESWRSAIDEIVSAEDTLIRNVLSGRKSLASAVLASTADMVTREIELDAKYATMRAFYTTSEMAMQKQAATGGLLAHLIAEQIKTAATVTGEEARVTAKKGALAQGMEADVAAGSAQVMNNAYKAASGAYSAVAGIPYVGPILAPVAAATAFTAVAAFDTLTSAEGGQWYVNGGFYQLHPQESVLPASIANPMRQFFTNGGGSDSGGGDTHIHIHATDARSVKNLIENNSDAVVSAFSKARRNGNRGTR